MIYEITYIGGPANGRRQTTPRLYPYRKVLCEPSLPPPIVDRDMHLELPLPKIALYKLRFGFRTDKSKANYYYQFTYE